jgi:sarcosine oxidase subunit gamma
MTFTRMSPVSHAQHGLSPKMGDVHGMEVALTFAAVTQTGRNQQQLGVCDVSCFARFGIKGPGAQAWLLALGVEIPAAANSWAQQANGALVLRLGNSEFLVEDQPGSQLCQALQAADASGSGLYKVPRYDAALILSGREVQNLLSELCTLDLSEKGLAQQALLMTQVAGISATVLRQNLNGEEIYRLWCDGTYGSYLWETVLQIAEELGGGAVGLSAHFKDVL